jgi:hypothetical protein
VVGFCHPGLISEQEKVSMQQLIKKPAPKQSPTLYSYGALLIECGEHHQLCALQATSQWAALIKKW